MKKWPLRFKITLLVAVVLTLACMTLTLNSIFSARGYYGILEGEVIVEQLPEGEIVEDRNDSPYILATRRFSMQGVAVMITAIVLSVAVTYWLAGRLLRPLTMLTSSIRIIDEERLHKRLELPGASGEVRQLMESFNGMMERLEGAFEMQKNFSANAAHELKTPLAVLKISLQVLEMDGKPDMEDFQEFAQAAKTSLNRLEGTVDALLSLTRGTGERDLNDVAPGPLVELVFSELKARAEAAGVSLALSGACPPVRGDQTLLYRILFNLIENAVKYNRRGGQVSVTLSRQGSRPWIRVADTGSGMPAEAVCHAFEPFYRADQSRSQKIPGSGLGLAVVKTIVEQYHGEISLSSTEGVGTTVDVVF